MTQPGANGHPGDKGTVWFSGGTRLPPSHLPDDSATGYLHIDENWTLKADLT